MSEQRSLFIMLLLSLLVACQPAPTPQPTEALVSPWGVPQIIGEAWRREAPALLVVENTAYFAWSNGSRHFFQYEGQPALELPITGRIPYGHVLLPLGDNLLLLWLDEDRTNQRVEVFGMVLSTAGGVQSAPLQISDSGAQRFTAVAAADNDSVQIVWSRNQGAVTNLHATTINRRGIPFPSAQIRSNADYPALLRDLLGNTMLFWMEYSSGVFASPLGESDGYASLDDPQAVTTLPKIGTGVSLDSFFAALDGTHAHLFWNTRSPGGRRTVLTATGLFSDLQLSQPATFSIQIAQGIYVEEIAFARPLMGQHLALPVVLTTSQELGVATFRDGSLDEYEALLPTPLLLAPPALDRSPQGRLVLAWSEAFPEQAANLTTLSSP